MFDILAGLFQSGRIIDFILILLVVESGLLYAYRRWTGRGLPAIDIVWNNLAGAGLLMALRAALTGGPWTGIAPWLLAAFAAHLADLAWRWRSTRVGPRP